MGACTEVGSSQCQATPEAQQTATTLLRALGQPSCPRWGFKFVFPVAHSSALPPDAIAYLSPHHPPSSPDRALWLQPFPRVDTSCRKLTGPIHLTAWGGLFLAPWSSQCCLPSR